MQLKNEKEDQEPSYDNLNPTIGKSEHPPKPHGIRQIVEKPMFKWTAIATVLTILALIVVVPTVLEVTKQGIIVTFYLNNVSTMPYHLYWCVF